MTCTLVQLCGVSCYRPVNFFYCWYIIERVSLSSLLLIDFVHCNFVVCYRVYPWPHPSGSDVPDFPENNYDVVRHAFLKVIDAKKHSC